MGGCSEISDTLCFGIGRSGGLLTQCRSKSNEFCGAGFCVSSVSSTSVKSTRLSVDAQRHVISRASGDVYMLEDNFPVLEGVTRSAVTELCHVRAWDLSPTRIPEILILVGGESPYWLVVGIEGDVSKRHELNEFLKNLRITAPQIDWPADTERPKCL